MRRKGQTMPGSQKERVAELMAQDLDRPQIMERLGITRNYFNARVADIRRDLGWQAV